MEIMETKIKTTSETRACRNPRALVVDDCEGIRLSLSLLLKRRGIQSVLAGDAAEAMKCFMSESFDLVVTDLNMPGTNGLELIKWIRNRTPLLPVIVVSGNLLDQMEWVAALSVTGVVRKPFEVKDVDDALSPILREFRG
jgi:two-component system response regulator (stage 0 sporulation protein F)